MLKTKRISIKIGPGGARGRGTMGDGNLVPDRGIPSKTASGGGGGGGAAGDGILISERGFPPKTASVTDAAARRAASQPRTRARRSATPSSTLTPCARADRQVFWHGAHTTDQAPKHRCRQKHCEHYLHGMILLNLEYSRFGGPAASEPCARLLLSRPFLL